MKWFEHKSLKSRYSAGNGLFFRGKLRRGTTTRKVGCRFWTRRSGKSRFSWTNGKIAKKRAGSRRSGSSKSLGQVKDEPIIPGFFPLVLGRYRYCRFTTSGEVLVKDRKNKRAKSSLSLAMAFGSLSVSKTPLPHILDIKYSPTQHGWLPRYAGTSGLKSIFLENTLNGTLSSDNRYVYAIDDLAVPALPTIAGA